MTEPVLRVEAVTKTYRLSRSIEVPALRGVSLEVDAGEFVAIVGPSGSGKTTLLNMAGLLDHQDQGEVYIEGRPTHALSDNDRARIRRNGVGFVFQSFNLLPHLTAEENVAMPLRYADDGVRRSPAELLQRVGLEDRRTHRPDELSGGEQQRVAIARALVLDPPLILADEPTGELDSETAAGIHAILRELRDDGKAILVVTHNEELTKIAGRSVHMRDGHVVDDGGTKRRAAQRVRKTPKSPKTAKPARTPKRAKAPKAARTRKRV